MNLDPDRIRGALLGLAVGDALGTTYEFERLAQPAYPELATGPAADVVGGGPFDLPAGAVTDDTQMAVCLARSLAEAGALDVDDLGRRYVAWSAHAFDIGNQTSAALRRIEAGADARAAGLEVWRASPAHHRPAGNGSLMRTAPIGVAYATRDRVELIDAALADSLITHADPRCAIACAVFDSAIAVALGHDDAATRATAMHDAALAAVPIATERLRAQWDGDDRAEISGGATMADLELARSDDPLPAGQGLDGRSLPRAVSAAERRCGSIDLYRTAGFVRVAFRLAFWHLRTASWRAALVDVASRGGDADTNAAITGALLGARDGASAIPAAWRERVLAATLPGPADWAADHHPRYLLALADTLGR